MSEAGPDPRIDVAKEIAAELGAAPKANGYDVGAAVELVPFRDLLTPNLATSGLVKGLINAESLALIYGEPGCGKTFLALDLALSVAAGLPWFAHKTKPGRVVYVAAEAGRSIINRVAAWAGEKWKNRGDIDFSAIVSPVDLCHIKKGDAQGDAQKLAKAIGRADMVVIDTVSRALAGGDENSPADMGAFVFCMTNLQKYLATAVVAIHHVGKDASRGARGHSLLKGAVDTEIAAERRDDGVCVATVTKQRDMVAGAKIAFRLRLVDLGEDQDGDSVTTCVVEAMDYAPEMKTQESELSPQTKDALALLRLIVAEKGVTMPFTDLEVRAVKVGQWREAMAANGRFGEVKSGKFRTAWSRAQSELADRRYIVFDEGYVWPLSVFGIDDVPF